jgi:hypothetical protein
MAENAGEARSRLDFGQAGEHRAAEIGHGGFHHDAIPGTAVVLRPLLLSLIRLIRTGFELLCARTSAGAASGTAARPPRTARRRKMDNLV